MRFNQNKCIKCGGKVDEAVGVLIEIPNKKRTKTKSPEWKTYHAWLCNNCYEVEQMTICKNCGGKGWIWSYGGIGTTPETCNICNGDGYYYV